MKSIDVFMLALIEHVKGRTNAMLVVLDTQTNPVVNRETNLAFNKQTNPAFIRQTNPAFMYPFRIMLEVRAERV